MIPFGHTLDARQRRPVLPANAEYSAPPLTVECFAKLESSTGFNILVANEPKSSATHWELYSYVGSGVLSVYMPGFEPAEVRSDISVTDGKWHYCAMTFDGRTARIFVDGRMVRSEPVLRRPGMAPVAGPLGVGDVPGLGIGCDGLIDEVRVSRVIRRIEGVPSAPFEDDADTLVLMHFDPEFAGVGESRLDDPFRAGAEAALRARKGLGGAEPSLVLVFDRLEGGLDARKRMLDAVGWFFDPATVYGCNGFGPLTRNGSGGTVAILAMGAGISVAAACAEVGGDHEACGRSLGRALKTDIDRMRTPRLAVLLGDCHVPSNDALTRGFAGAVGQGVPVVGGACPLNGFVYDRGVVKQNANLALILGGEFDFGFGMQTASHPEAIPSTARQAASDAVGDRSGDLALLLVFNCVSRLQALGARAHEELAALNEIVRGAPVFGFYGSGEIGMERAGRQPRGVGAHIVTAALLRR